MIDDDDYEYEYDSDASDESMVDNDGNNLDGEKSGYIDEEPEEDDIVNNRLSSTVNLNDGNDSPTIIQNEQEQGMQIRTNYDFNNSNSFEYKQPEEDDIVSPTVPFNRNNNSLSISNAQPQEMSSFGAQIKTNYLKGKLELISNSEPDPPLLESLKEILRNQSPTSWKTCQELYKTAVACCVEINLYHPDRMGRKSDKGSLFVALSEFAQQAKVIAKSGLAMNYDCDLEQFAVEVSQIAVVTEKYFSKKEEKLQMIASKDLGSGVTDTSNNVPSIMNGYVNSLRPHCFAFVEDFVEIKHAFESKDPVSLQAHVVFRELAAYTTQLPVEYASSILVRACSSKLHLVRACILGPDNSPYANGIFLFDIFLQNYPHEPPKVRFLTTGQGKYRQNPNLYQDGMVCLSLLGTWEGDPWISGKSTLLQVLVSIQSLIFVDDPYFNEPGYEKGRGSPQGDECSRLYNVNLYHQVAETAIVNPLYNRRTVGRKETTGHIERKEKVVPREFETAVKLHFKLKRDDIDEQLQRWSKQSERMKPLLKSYQDYWMSKDKLQTSEVLEDARRELGLKSNGSSTIDDDDRVKRAKSESLKETQALKKSKENENEDDS